MDSRDDIPRISVPSARDWQRIKASLRSTVLADLDNHINANDLAAERDALHAHMNQRLDRAFKMAQANLRINGQNYETLDENEHNMEPFDEALDRRIWSLADVRLQYQKRIAEIRRTVPQQIEVSMQDLFKRQHAVDAEVAAAFQDSQDEDMMLEDVDETIPRHSQIEEGFYKTAALGKELEQTTVSQEERVQRARIATGEVKVLKP